MIIVHYGSTGQGEAVGRADAAVRRRIWGWTLAAVLLLGGCASMSEDQCRNANWEEVGFQDGLRGRSAQRLVAYREDCGKIGVKPDDGRWRIGHLRAIPIYCSPDNAVRAGVEGWAYEGICPPEIEAGFLNRYRAGRMVYEARQHVARIDSDIRSVDSELRRSDVSAQRRRDLERRRIHLISEQNHLRTQLMMMELQLR